MRVLAVGLALVIASTACGGDATESTREIAVRPPVDPQAWILVEAVQTECCYVEGSTDVLEITNRDGFRMAELAFANKEAVTDDQFVGRFERSAVGLGPHTVTV